MRSRSFTVGRDAPSLQTGKAHDPAEDSHGAGSTHTSVSMRGTGSVPAFVEEILSLIYLNPPRINLNKEILATVRRYVACDDLTYLCEDPDRKFRDDRVRVFSGMSLREDELEKNIRLVTVRSRDTDAAFEEIFKQHYLCAIEGWGQKEFHIHRLRAMDHPRATLAFLRVKEKAQNNAFTNSEIRQLNALGPHLLFIVRLIGTIAQRVRKYRLLDTVAITSSKLTRQCNLSAAEVRLLPDILDGHTVETIAERQFLSMGTVKTHISHILKKTGSKSRMDLISNFFIAAPPPEETSNHPNG